MNMSKTNINDAGIIIAPPVGTVGLGIKSQERLIETETTISRPRGCCDQHCNAVKDVASIGSAQAVCPGLGGTVPHFKREMYV